MTGKVCVSGMYHTNNMCGEAIACEPYYGYASEEGATEAYYAANLKLRGIIKDRGGRLEHLRTNIYQEVCGRVGTEDYECIEIEKFPTNERTVWDEFVDLLINIWGNK